MRRLQCGIKRKACMGIIGVMLVFCIGLTACGSNNTSTEGMEAAATGSGEWQPGQNPAGGNATGRYVFWYNNSY